MIATYDRRWRSATNVPGGMRVARMVRTPPNRSGMGPAKTARAYGMIPAAETRRMTPWAHSAIFNRHAPVDFDSSDGIVK